MKQVSVNQNKNSFFKVVLSALVCAALFSSQIFVLGTNIANGQSKKDNKYERRINNIKNASAKYREAMKSLASLSNQPIDSEEAVIKAVNTLDGLRSTLTDGSYASLVNLVFADAAFNKSVEAEVDKVGADKLLKMIKQNPEMVFEFTNAKKIQSNMEKQLAADANTYQTLGNKLKTVEEKFGDKTGVNNYRVPFSKSSSGHFRISKASYDFASQYEANFLLNKHPVFQNNELTTEPEMTPFDGGISAAIVAGVSLLIAAYAAAKGQDFNEDEEGNSDFKICVDEANSRLQNCLQDANKKKGFAKFVKKAGCWARHGFDMNVCLVIPQ